MIGLSHEPENARFSTIHEETTDLFVRKLRGVCSRATLEFAIQVGKLVIDTFYGGNVAHYRARSGNHPSLRSLAGRSDLPVSLSHLYRCVAIYAASYDLPDFSTWKHLGASHVRTVLDLPHEEQRRLLSFAESEAWTVQRLEHEARPLRKGSPSKPGRPPLSEKLRRLSNIKRWLEDCPDPVGTIDSGDVDERFLGNLRSHAESVQKWLNDLARKIERSQAERPGRRAL